MSSSAYQEYKEYKKIPDIEKMYTQIHELRSLLINYNDNSPNSSEKIQEINNKAKELYRKYSMFSKLRVHITKLLDFIRQHTLEFKEIQKDFYEIKNLLQSSQTSDIIHMDVAVNTPYGNLIEKLLKTTDSKKRQRTSEDDGTKRQKTHGRGRKTKRRKRRKESKNKKHITQRLKPRFKTTSKPKKNKKK